MKQTRFHWLWMLPVFMLTIYSGAAHLNDDAIWFDEWITYFISGTGNFDAPPLAGTPCAEILGDTGIPPLDTLCLTAIDNSWPPAFFLLLKGWDFISGGVTFTDRILALLIGLLAVSVVYALGKRAVSADAGLIAAALLASCAFFIYYTHEVRGYTLYVLMPALTGWFYWLLLDSRHYTKRWLKWGFVLSIAATLYTHYIGIAVVLGIGLYHVLLERVRKGIFRGKRVEGSITPHRWSLILKLGINGCLLYAPWVAVLFISFLNESITERSLDTLSLLRATLYGYSNNLWWIVIPALLLTLRHWRVRVVRFLWVWALTILLVSIAANIFADFLFHPRHIMGMLPAFMLLIAFAFSELIRSFGAAWLLPVLWIVAGMIYSASPAFMNNLPRHVSTVPLAAMTQIVDTAKQCLTPDDLLVVGIDEARDEWVHDQPLGYYLDETGANFIHLGALMTNDGDNPSALLPRDLRDAAFDERLAAFTAGAEHVWLLTLPDLAISEELSSIDQMLEDADYHNCGTFDTNAALNSTVYTQNAAQCQQIIQSCQR